jgi:predicted Holliday junction resolvase-like endonuclease
MEFLRNALFVFIIGVVVVVVVVVVMVVVVLLSSVRVLRPAHIRCAEEERTQKHAFFALEKNIARAFDVSSLTRSSNEYKKTSEGIRMKSISSPRREKERLARARVKKNKRCVR